MGRLSTTECTYLPTYLERDVNEVEHDGQLCRPMQGSATMSCADDKNLNANDVHRELVTVYISESLAQLQELQESSSLRDPILGVFFHELATCEGAEMNFFERGHNNPPRFAQALWSVQYHKLWV